MNKVIITGLVAVFVTACHPSTQNQNSTTVQAEQAGMVEITTFKLNQGVSTDDFKIEAVIMQKDFLEKQDGFIKRTLTVSADSVWTDIVFWKDRQSAEKTMQLAEKSEVVLPFIEKIDFNSVKMNLTTPILMQE